MRTEELAFNIQNDAAGFLGIKIDCQDDHAKLTQPGHIDRIIVALGLQNADPVCVPAPKAALGQDKDGTPFEGDFNYASVIGMMMYVSNNTCPDIAFAIN
eukprot:5600475-Ditylum_brightwellii.AAC.1